MLISSHENSLRAKNLELKIEKEKNSAYKQRVQNYIKELNSLEKEYENLKEELKYLKEIQATDIHLYNCLLKEKNEYLKTYNAVEGIKKQVKKDIFNALDIKDSNHKITTGNIREFLDLNKNKNIEDVYIKLMLL